MSLKASDDDDADDDDKLSNSSSNATIIVSSLTFVTIPDAMFSSFNSDEDPCTPTISPKKELL